MELNTRVLLLDTAISTAWAASQAMRVRVRDEAQNAASVGRLANDVLEGGKRLAYGEKREVWADCHRVRIQLRNGHGAT